MESAGSGGEPPATFTLRSGDALRIGPTGVAVGDTLYRLDQIGAVWQQLADPASLALQLTDGRLVPLTLADASDAPRALAEYYRWRGVPPLPVPGPAGAWPPYPYGPPPYPYGPPPYPYGPPPYLAYPPPPSAYAPYPAPRPTYPSAPMGYYPAPPYPPMPPAGQSGSGARTRGGVGPWPHDVGENIQAIFRLYFQNFWRFLVLSLLTVLWPALLAGGLVVAYLYALGLDPFQNLYAQLSVGASGGSPFSPNAPFFHLSDLSPEQIALLLLAALGWVILTLVLGAWQIAALAAGARESVAGRTVKIGAALRTGLGRLLPVLGTNLLYGLILGGLFLIAYAAVFGFVFLAFAAGSPGNPLGMDAGSAGAFLLFLLVFFVVWAVLLCAVIYLSIRLGFAPYAAASDRLGPGRAIAQSWSVTRRNWWRTFVVLLVVGLATGVITGLAGGGGQYLPLGVEYLIVTPLLTMLAAPLTVVAYLVLYYDLRLRRDGYPAVAHDLGLPGVAPNPSDSPPAS